MTVPITSDVEASTARPPRAGKVGFWLAVITAVVVTTGPLILAAVFSSTADGGGTGDGPASPNPLGMIGILVLAVVGSIPWATGVTATVFGIVSLSRRERPVVWAVIALMSLPFVVLMATIVRSLT